MLRRTGLGAHPWGLSARGLLGVLATGIAACGQGTGDGPPGAPAAAVDAAAPVHLAPTSVPTKVGFLGVWGSSDKDVWAVGDSGTAMHFDGEVWSLTTTGVTESLTCVHGTAPDNVWVTGANGDVLHWNGTAWTVDTALQGTTLLGVLVMSPTDVW